MATKQKRSSTGNSRKSNTKASTSGKSKGAPANEGAGKGDSLLQEFFVDSLRDIYYAEKAIIKALPKMKKAATSPELADAFAEHLEVTKAQVERLDKVFKAVGETARGKKCEAIVGLIKEGESIVEDTDEGTSTRDVGLIMAAQKIEHYEIATYGGLVQLASTLGEGKAAQLLQQTLDEEKETDVALTGIAENNINYQAADETEED